MRLTWEERSHLVMATAELVLQWLALLDDRSKAVLITSMLVHGYTSPELQRLNKQATIRIAALKADAATGSA